MSKELCDACKASCVFLEILSSHREVQEIPDEALELLVKGDRQDYKAVGCPYWNIPLEEVGEAV